LTDHAILQPSRGPSTSLSKTSSPRTPSDVSDMEAFDSSRPRSPPSADNIQVTPLQPALPEMHPAHPFILAPADVGTHACDKSHHQGAHLAHCSKHWSKSRCDVPLKRLASAQSLAEQLDGKLKCSSQFICIFCRDLRADNMYLCRWWCG